MLRQAKEQFVQSMRQDMERAAGVVFVDYNGLTVDEVEQLRRKLRAAMVDYRVVKNTLMQRVLEGTSYEGARAYLKGTPTGMVLGYNDAVTAAKLTCEFLSECEHLKIKGG